MAKVSVYNIEGNQVGDIELSNDIFGVEVNKHLLHFLVVNQLANKRQGTQSAKTRAEVSGGGRKPWKQKGTGHARQGSIRAPQWKGGGIVFAPKPRDYSFKVNRKERRLAIKSALSQKVNDNNLLVVEGLSLNEIKTKNFVNILSNLKAENALVVTGDRNVILSARNVNGVETVAADQLNVYDILKYNKLVIAKELVAKVEEVYA